MKPVRLVSLVLAGAVTLGACDRNAPELTAADPGAPALDVAAGDQDIPLLMTDGEGAYVAGQVIAKFTPGANAHDVAQGHGAGVGRQMKLARTFVLHVPAGQEKKVAEALSHNPNIEFAEPDYVMAVVPCETGICETTNDPFLGYKWDLNNNGTIFTAAGVLQNTPRTDVDIDWQETYDYLGAGFSGGAVIGVIDTGIRKTHQDLAGKVIAERNFATGYPATFTDDRNSHGTHVAGIAAAHGNNGVGVAGVAYGQNIKLINAKACELYQFPDGTISTSCPTSSTADAIIWATDQGANVLNLSLGGSPAATSGSAAQRAALQYARAHNVLPFCATGNDNYPGIAFPARFPECVAVGATNWNDARASYSNYGAEIALSAPGGDSNPTGSPYSFILSSIYSSTNPTSNTTYGWKAGTSMATPQAAGLAALLFATGMTDAGAVLEMMKSTTDDLGPAGWDPQFGAGRINAYRAVTRGISPNAPPVSVPNGTYAGQEGSPVSFSSAGSADPNGKPVTFQWSFGDGTGSTDANPAHTYADDGAYTVTLTVRDQSGLTQTSSTTTVIANAAPVVQAALGSGSLFSGQTTSLTGSFTDAGALDAPWSWQIDWGTGAATTGSTGSQATTIQGSHRFCAARAYAVTLRVTDKDGASGTDGGMVTVSANAVTITSPDAISRMGNGAALIPVTILSTAGFDATTVNPASVTLGAAGDAATPVAVKPNGELHASVQDVNGDGRPDLSLRFERSRLELDGATQLVLLGTLSDGCVQVRGARSVRIVP